MNVDFTDWATVIVFGLMSLLAVFAFSLFFMVWKGKFIKGKEIKDYEKKYSAK